MHLRPISHTQWAFGRRIVTYEVVNENKKLQRIEKQCPICKVDSIPTGFNCCPKCYEYAYYYHQSELSDNPDDAIAIVGSLLDPTPTGKQAAQALVDKWKRIFRF